MSELVSVIITTCNGTRKLVRAIESVLNQTYKNLEVLVIDDNGKNTSGQLQTEEMISDYTKTGKIKYIAHDVNKNGAAARNTGVRNAAGTYLAFLDDDDFFLPERVERFVDVIEKEEADMIYSAVLFVKNKSIVSIMSANEDGFSYQDLLENQSLLGTGSNIFVKRNIYLKINGFDESFFRYQDVEFMIRALRVGKIKGINECLVAKDITDVRFYPKYEKFLMAQKMFFEKFAQDINELTPSRKRNALYIKRTELYYSACLSKEKNNINDAYMLLENDIPGLTGKEQLKIKLRGLYMRYLYKTFGILRNIKQIVKSKKIEESCTNEFKMKLRKAIEV